jgi:hypothetical protein
MAFGEIEDVGRRVGISLTILASGALAGPPIAGAINSATGGFKAVGYYAGARPAVLRVNIVYRHIIFRQHGRIISDAYDPLPSDTSEMEAVGKFLRKRPYSCPILLSALILHHRSFPQHQYHCD